jgi:hypothetical protein
MRAIKLRRPSPALILSGVALFIALGGTGYAATHSAATKPVTKSTVNKLIAKYVKSHKKELTGAAGAPGSIGGAGGVGPQGPGAIQLHANNSSTESSAMTAGTAGPWTISLKCNGGNATMKVDGPGTAEGTSSLAGGGGTADTYVNGPAQIGGGLGYVIGVGGQQSLDLFLRSGSTMFEVRAVVTAVNGGLFTDCDLAGDAIPVQ